MATYVVICFSCLIAFCLSAPVIDSESKMAAPVSCSVQSVPGCPKEPHNVFQKELCSLLDYYAKKYCYKMGGKVYPFESLRINVSMTPTELCNEIQKTNQLVFAYSQNTTSQVLDKTLCNQFSPGSKNLYSFWISLAKEIEHLDAKSPVTKSPVTKSLPSKSLPSKSLPSKSPVIKSLPSKSPVIKSPVIKSPPTKSPVIKSPPTKSPVIKSPPTKSNVANEASANNQAPDTIASKVHKVSTISNSSKTAAQNTSLSNRASGITTKLIGKIQKKVLTTVAQPTPKDAAFTKRTDSGEKKVNPTSRTTTTTTTTTATTTMTKAKAKTTLNVPQEKSVFSSSSLESKKDEIKPSGQGSNSEATNLNQDNSGLQEKKEPVVSTQPKFDAPNNAVGLNSKQGKSSSQNNFNDSPSSAHFMGYFLTAIVLCITGYVLFHNKQKIIAFIIEGRNQKRGRRPNTGEYRKLQTNVDDVMSSLDKSTSSQNYIY